MRVEKLPPSGRSWVAKTHTFECLSRKIPVSGAGTLLALNVAAVRTMLRLKPAQRAVLVDKLPDMANIVAGAIVIGFAIGDPRASWPLLMTGLGLWAGALVFVLSIAEDKP